MDDTQILDGENYRGTNEGYTFKEICMKQLSKVVNNFSQEMREGFYIYSQTAPNMASVKTRYIGDSRAELRQSVNCLHDLIQPKFDDDMKTKSKELNEEYEEWRTKCKDEGTKNDEGEYWDKTLTLYRTLFQQICFFLERLGWLETSSLEDE